MDIKNLNSLMDKAESLNRSAILLVRILKMYGDEICAGNRQFSEYHFFGLHEAVFNLLEDNSRNLDRIRNLIS